MKRTPTKESPRPVRELAETDLARVTGGVVIIIAVAAVAGTNRR
jgi:hypothetical protein